MKKIFLIEDTLTNKISYYHILFFIVSLPFDRFYSQLILISFAIHTLIHVKKYDLKSLMRKELYILASVYFITLFCTLYTVNTKQAFLEWDKQMGIFLIPLLLCLTPLNINKYRPQLLLAFALTCTLTIVYLYIAALNIINSNNLPLSRLFSVDFINHNFSAPIGTHATYLSMYVALSLTYFLYLFINETSVNKKLFYVFCSTILFLGIIQLCSKSVFIALFLIVNIVLPFFLFHGIKRIKFLATSLFCSILIITIISNIDIFKTRYLKDLENDLTKTSIPNEEYRLVRWHSALEVIKSSPLTGYGTGSEVAVLKERYFANKLYNSFVAELNAHNQYLSFLIKSGIVGLLIYLYTLWFGVSNAIRRTDILFMSFLILISTVSLAENILDVNKGVFFYSFFFAFFVFSGDEERRDD